MEHATTFLMTKNPFHKPALFATAKVAKWLNQKTEKQAELSTMLLGVNSIHLFIGLELKRLV